MTANILWIEGKRANSPSLIPSVRRKGYQIEVVHTGANALEKINRDYPNLLVLNAASLRSSGIRICHTIQQTAEWLPILVITTTDRPYPDDSGANVILTLPFTARKLLNRIGPLLPQKPETVLTAGPITLDPDNRMLYCQGREVQLNPRLTALLATFLKNPGEVQERERLFREVWDTDYTGDTRTLDVHISWLRRALEENPREPQFLKTVRGVGYRLDADG